MRPEPVGTAKGLPWCRLRHARSLPHLLALVSVHGASTSAQASGKRTLGMCKMRTCISVPVAGLWASWMARFRPGLQRVGSLPRQYARRCRFAPTCPTHSYCVRGWPPTSTAGSATRPPPHGGGASHRTCYWAAALRAGRGIPGYVPGWPCRPTPASLRRPAPRGPVPAPSRGWCGEATMRHSLGA